MREGEASTTARRVAAQRLEFDRVPCPWSDSGEGADADQRLQADVAGGVPVTPTAMTRHLQVVRQATDPAGVDVLESTRSSAFVIAVAA